MRTGEKLRELRIVEGAARGLHRELTQAEVSRGIVAQSPMRIALAEDGNKAIDSFGKRAWAGIVTAVDRLRGNA